MPHATSQIYIMRFLHYVRRRLCVARRRLCIGPTQALRRYYGRNDMEKQILLILLILSKNKKGVSFCAFNIIFLFYNIVFIRVQLLQIIFESGELIFEKVLVIRF